MTLEDSGELITCAVTLSNAHSPGFPFHALLGRLACLIPAGNIGFRLNLLSAAAGAFGALALMRLVLLTGGALGFPSRSFRIGELAAVAVLVVSPTFWWQSSITEKYQVFVALFAWSLLLLHQLGRGGTARIFLSVFFLWGIAFGWHYQAIYLVLPLAWALWRVPGPRSRVLAAFFATLPLAARFLYVPVRAASGPPVNWGVPDSLPRLLDYASFLAYRSERFLFGGSGAGAGWMETLVRLRAHAIEVPWGELGPALVFAAAGFWAVWRGDRRTAVGAMAVVGVNVAITVNYRTSHFALYDLPFLLVLAALAGVGFAWMAHRWSRAAALALAAALAVAGAWRHAPFAMRDRDYFAQDHLRNLLACAPPGSLVVTDNDTWLFPLWYAENVEPLSGVHPVYTRQIGCAQPDGKMLDGRLGGRTAGLRLMQYGPAILRELGKAAAPAAVCCDGFSVLAPSQGVEWRGILLEIGRSGGNLPFDDPLSRMRAGARAVARLPRDAHSRMRPGGRTGRVRQAHLPFDGDGGRLAGRLLLRSMAELEGVSAAPGGLYSVSSLRMAPAPLLMGRLHRGLMEWTVSDFYARGFLAQAGLALEAGRPGAASRLVSLAARIQGRMPEVHELAGRVAFALGKLDEAEAEWRKALKLAGGGLPEACLGLSRLAGRRGNQRESLDQLWKAAALLAGPGDPLVQEGDRLRRAGLVSGASQACRRAVADGFAHRAALLLDVTRPAEARAEIRQALEWDSPSAATRFQVGRLAFIEERFADALREFTAARARDPGLPSIADVVERTRAAVAWQAKLPEVEAALAARPGDPASLCDAGNAAWHLGRSVAAERLYRSALAKSPGYARAWNNLGSALVDQRRMDEAILAYRNAVRADPRYAEAMANLGAVYLGMGDHVGALEWSGKALAVDPGNEAARGIGEAAGGRH